MRIESNEVGSFVMGSEGGAMLRGVEIMDEGRGEKKRKKKKKKKSQVLIS